MRKTINCFIPYRESTAAEQTIHALKESSIVNKIYLLNIEPNKTLSTPEGCEILPVDSLTSSKTMKMIAEKADTPYILLYTKTSALELAYKALERMTDFLQDRKQKYRFGNIRFDGRGMSADEQKHYLYDHVFKALNASLGYEDFKKRLAEESIRVTEHVNSKGAYGISFYMENVENAHVFKGADLSRKLTYQNIQKHFDGVAVGLSPHIDRVGEFRERVDREAFYMQGGGVMAIPELDITGSGKKSQEDDLIPSI